MPSRQWYVGAHTFSELARLTEEGLHLLGLSRERSVITVRHPEQVGIGGANTAAGTVPLVFVERNGA